MWTWLRCRGWFNLCTKKSIDFSLQFVFWSVNWFSQHVLKLANALNVSYKDNYMKTYIWGKDFIESSPKRCYSPIMRSWPGAGQRKKVWLVQWRRMLTKRAVTDQRRPPRRSITTVIRANSETILWFLIEIWDKELLELSDCAFPKIPKKSMLLSLFPRKRSKERLAFQEGFLETVDL